MPDNNCFEFGAAHLPEGWELTVSIESGFAGIELFDANGTLIECDRLDDEAFPDFVRRVVRKAVRLDEKRNATP